MMNKIWEVCKEIENNTKKYIYTIILSYNNGVLVGLGLVFGQGLHTQKQTPSKNDNNILQINPTVPDIAGVFVLTSCLCVSRGWVCIYFAYAHHQNACVEFRCVCVCLHWFTNYSIINNKGVVCLCACFE